MPSPSSDFSDTDLSVTRMSDNESDQDELAQAIYKIKNLRKENDALRNNFRRLKQVHASALEECKRVQLAYNRAQEERIIVDKEYQRLCDTWRGELEEKQRLLEQAKTQILTTRDVDLMRVKILEETETSYRTKYAAIERENETLQHSVSTLRKDLATARADLETSTRSISSDAEILRLQCDRLKQEVRDESNRNQTLMESNADFKRRLASAESDKLGLVREMDALREEIKDARSRGQQAVVSREALAVDYERTIARLKAECADLQKASELMDKRRHVAEEGLRASARTNQAMHEQVSELEATARRLEVALEEQRKRADGDRKALENQILSRQHAAEDREVDLRAQIAHREEQLLKREQEHVSATETIRQQYDAMLKERDQRLAQRMSELERDKASLEARLHAADQSAADAARQHREELREMQVRLDTAKAEVGDARLRLVEAQQSRERHQEALARKEAEFDEQRKELVRLTAELDAHSTRQADIRSRADVLAVENRSMAQRLSALEQELAEEKRKAELDRTQLVSELDGAKRSFAAERASLMKRATSQLQNTEEKYDAKLYAMRQRLSALKSTATKYAEERAELLLRQRDLEAKLEAAGIAAGLGPGSAALAAAASLSIPGLPSSGPAASSVSAVDELLTMLQPELDRIKARQQEYLDLVNPRGSFSSLGAANAAASQAAAALRATELHT